MHGEGIVTLVCGDWSDYAVHVDFSDELSHEYLKDGRLYDDCLPTLYPLAQYLNIRSSLPDPVSERWIPEAGQFVWVRDEFGMPQLRKFLRIEDGEYVCQNPVSDCEDSWDLVEPFEGKLPDIVKAKED